jgi:hypothetical protein
LNVDSMTKASFCLLNRWVWNPDLIS